MQQGLKAELLYLGTLWVNLICQGVLSGLHGVSKNISVWASCNDFPDNRLSGAAISVTVSRSQDVNVLKPTFKFIISSIKVLIHNFPLKSNQSINRQMDKEDVAHIYNGILLSNKKKWNWVICSEVDGPRDCHTEWSKSKRKKQINKYHMLTHIYGI